MSETHATTTIKREDDEREKRKQELNKLKEPNHTSLCFVGCVRSPHDDKLEGKKNV